MAVCWLIPRLGEFQALAPTTEVRLVYAFHGQPVEFRDVDVAIVFAPDPPTLTGAVVERFLSGETAPICAPHFGLGPSATGADMVRAGLLHDTDATGWRTWLQTEGEPTGSAPGPVFEDFNLLRAAVLAGQGVALCPLAIVSDDLREGRLVQLSQRTIRRESACYVAIRDDESLPSASAARLFRGWIIVNGDRQPAPSRSCRRSSAEASEILRSEDVRGPGRKTLSSSMSTSRRRSLSTTSAGRSRSI